jgi:hypothetical protein
MLNNNKNFEQLKKEFYKSAIELLDYMYINNKNFNGETYPQYLPSFDEFIYDIMDLEEVDE